MTTVTIEREGYKVEGEVRAISTGPGIKPGLEVVESEEWIHDEQGFREAHGMEPTDENLRLVVSKEIDAICDELIDAAREDY